MARELAWSDYGLASRDSHDRANDFPDFRENDTSWPQQFWPSPNHRDNGGLHPNRARASVEDQVHLVTEPVGDMLGRRRTDIPKGFALGAAMGVPASRISACATGWSGILTAMVGKPAVTSSGTT